MRIKNWIRRPRYEAAALCGELLRLSPEVSAVGVVGVAVCGGGIDEYK